MKETGTAYLLWALAFLGLFGFHRFYLDRPATGCLWLLTFGFCGVGQAIDLLLIPGMVKQANREYRELNPPPTQTIIIHVNNSGKGKKRANEEEEEEESDPFNFG
jgi:hypothetical protein